MRIKFFILAIFSLPALFFHNIEIHAKDEFLLGNQVLLNKSSKIIHGKNIGLITNSSGILQDGTLFLDALNKSFIVSKIFTPEHGLRGDDKDENYVDSKTGIPIISLYGSKKIPGSSDLENIDVLVYDIQDVGARFYTFINTMYYCMESSAEYGKEIIICDRPIIPEGSYVDGFMLDKDCESFVGLINIPVAYGMTCGELAEFINAEYFNGKCRLTIVKMENYSRGTDYDDLNLTWVKPSPSMYFPSSAIAYSGTCLLEGTNFSEGRGTDRPFEYIGAPYCDGKRLASELSSYNLKGVEFEAISFTPTNITSPSNPPKYVNEKCEGVFIKFTDKKSFEPFKAGIAVLAALRNLFPEFEVKQNNFLDKLAGTKNLRIMLHDGKSYNQIINSYEEQLMDFRRKRANYLLYP